MNLSKGLNNLLKPTYLNFILALCLIIILSLIYLKTNKLDLFDPTISTPFTSDNYLKSFINNYSNKIKQQNANLQILSTQEQTIQTLSQQVANLINPST